jgi:acyl-CoA synthetase (AMP-forming)/AMP-acid ligase II
MTDANRHARRTAPFDSPVDALRRWSERAGAKEALAFPLSGGRLTYRAWYEKSLALARALLDIGLAPGSHVALLAENRLEWPLVQMGVAAMGGVLVPLNTHYRREDLAYAMTRSRSRAIILSPEFRSNAYLAMLDEMRAQLPDLEHVIALDAVEGREPPLSDLLERGHASRRELPRTDPFAPASLQYTSGTTGFPKGALLHYAGMLEDAWATASRLHFGQGERYTSIIPLFHCAGCVMGLQMCLQAGATYVGVPYFDPETVFRVIQEERCTALSGVPTSWLAMLDHPARASYDLSTLRTGTCGGADANPDVLNACREHFPIPELVQVYGQTECSTLISASDCKAERRVETAGPPLDGCEVRITHPETGAPLLAGEIGQIEARGVMVMIGYHDLPEATAEAIDADGWLKTGDLGTLTPEGRLLVAGGRLRDMIIRGGENIYPVEIENVLATHPAIAEATVFAIPDDYYGEIPGAAVRLRGPVSASALAAHCRQRIARFKTPARWFVVDRFPVTASGKIRKVELRQLAIEGKLEPLS